MDINPNSNSGPFNVGPSNSGSGSSTGSNSTSGSSQSNAASSASATDPAAKRFIDQLNGNSADRVSLSYKAQKLNLIQAEFFAGPIRSDQIPALTQRLFEDGLISSQEYQQLGGVSTSQTVSAVSESVHFLNRFILDEAVDGDSDGAKSLLNALTVIEEMNLPATEQRRVEERQALVYVSDYTEMLKETGAPADIIKGFEQVTEVLQALDKVRSNEAKTGALASYASVEETHQQLFNGTD